MLLVAILILISNVVLLIGAGVVYVRSTKNFAELHQGFKNYFSPQGQNNASPFGETLDAITDVMAQKIGVTVQASIRGAMGGTMKGVNHALEDVAREENPSLAMMDALPKSLKKNPIALMGLQALIARSGGSGGSGGTRGNGSQAQFKL